MTSEYICIKEDKLAELEARAEYKEKRIEELDRKMDKIDGKLDKLTANVNNIMLHSIQDDNNLNQRVTALESKQETLYRLLLAIPAIIALLGVIAVYINYIH
jgi:chaperonin cofactor prefoldin